MEQRVEDRSYLYVAEWGWKWDLLTSCEKGVGGIDRQKTTDADENRKGRSRFLDQEKRQSERDCLGNRKGDRSSTIHCCRSRPSAFCSIKPTLRTDLCVRVCEVSPRFYTYAMNCSNHSSLFNQRRNSDRQLRKRIKANLWTAAARGPIDGMGVECDNCFGKRAEEELFLQQCGSIRLDPRRASN